MVISCGLFNYHNRCIMVIVNNFVSCTKLNYCSAWLEDDVVELVA